MRKFNIALAIEIGEIFTADFISMAILAICMCFPVIFMVWLGIHNYRETGHVFLQVNETHSTNINTEEEIQYANKMPSPDPTLDNK